MRSHAPTPVELRVESLEKAWSTPTLRGLDLRVGPGEAVAVLGPSGCGKTTLLRIVAGLETPDSGSVHIGETDVTRTAPSDRGVGMVFQHHALLPHLSVGDNIGFGLAARRRPASEVAERVGRAARLVGCEALLNRSPTTLSGGERQRVALARSLVREPRLVLLDEPLSSLDVHVRSAMRTELRSALVASGSTVLHVTHDQAEAFAVADRVAVLGDGVVQQIGTADELYDRPACRDVASFVGSPRMNFLEVRVAQADRHAGPFALDVPAALGDRNLIAGLRPTDLRLTGLERSGPSAVVAAVEIVDESSIVHVDVDGIRLCAVTRRSLRPRVGQIVGMSADVQRFHLFDAITGAALHHAS